MLLDDLEHPVSVTPGALSGDTAVLRWDSEAITLTKPERPTVRLEEGAIAALQLSRSEHPGSRTLWDYLRRRDARPLHRLHAELRGRAVGRMRFDAETLDGSLLEGLPVLESQGERVDFTALRDLLVAARVHGATVARMLNPKVAGSSELPIDVQMSDEEKSEDPTAPIRASDREIEEGKHFEPVSQGRLYGFTSEGYGDIRAEYKDVMRFSYGRAPVRFPDTGLWGYIDPEGTVVIPPRFGAAFPFDAEGRAEAVMGPSLVEIDAAGRLLRSIGRVQTEVQLPNPPPDLGFLKLAATPPPRPPAEPGGPKRLSSDEIARGDQLESFQEDGLYGFRNRESGRALPPRFKDVDRFSHGRAAVRAYDDRGLWGYIDPRGTYVIAPQFASAFRFNGEGRAEVVRLDGSRVWLDVDGNVI